MRQRRILLLAALMVFLALFASGCRQWAAFNRDFEAGFVSSPLMRTALDPSFGVPDLVSADHRSENLGSGLMQDSVSTGGGGGGCPT